MNTPRLRAEWESQSAILLTWPHSHSDWHDSMQDIESVYAKMTNAIAESQRVIIVAFDQQHVQHIRKQVIQHASVVYVVHKTNDTWVRDYGPLTIELDGKPQSVDFRFNAWGGKYSANLDDALTYNLHEQLFTCPLRTQSLILEGGAIETDGTGTLLATRRSVIDERRNPGMSQQQIESVIQETLGINHFNWLDFTGMHGDDTDGHIDTIVRFTTQTSILYATCRPEHPDFAVLQSLEQQLEQIQNPQGVSYELIPLPCPGIHLHNGDYSPASYANFLITNELVLMPVYHHKNDEQAVDTVQQCFPERIIVPIDSRALITQNGSIHCATMQISCPIEV